MTYTIKNKFLSVTAKSLGAELTSIKNLKNGTEYLWQGDAAYWEEQAPNVFPVCGRLTENKYTYRGKTYFLQRHGFARTSEFELLKKDETSLTFILKANDKTRQAYPFEFEYTVTYVLDNNMLKTIYSAKNLGNDTMYCAFGGHPAFNVPLDADGNFEDYYIEFKSGSTQTELLFKDFLFTGNFKPFKVNKNRLDLKRDFFIHDAHFIIESGGQCILKSTKSDKSITVTYPQMKYLALWHTFDLPAPFLCIEPWTSIHSYYGKIDDLETKLDMFALSSGEEKSAGFDITIN